MSFNNKLTASAEATFVIPDLRVVARVNLVDLLNPLKVVESVALYGLAPITPEEVFVLGNSESWQESHRSLCAGDRVVLLDGEYLYKPHGVELIDPFDTI